MKKIYFSLVSSIHPGFFRNEMIMLDIYNDKYHIFNQKTSELIANILNHGISFENGNFFLCVDQNQINVSRLIKIMLDNSIFLISQDPCPIIEIKSLNMGLSELEWRLPEIFRKKRFSNTQIMKSFWILTKIYIMLRGKNGLYKLISLIKTKAEFNLKNFTVPEKDLLQDLSNSISTAAKFFPKSIKCLEWGICFILMALNYGWKCNICIGVQNYPFLSHAWVECDQEVLFDNKDLPLHLCVLLREPFIMSKV